MTTLWTLVQDTIQLVLAEHRRLLLPEVAEQAALLLLRQGERDQALAVWHTAAGTRRMVGIPQLPSLLRWYGDQTAVLETGSVDLPPATLDDLSTLLASVLPSADA